MSQYLKSFNIAVVNHRSVYLVYPVTSHIWGILESINNSHVPFCAIKLLDIVTQSKDINSRPSN